MCHVHRSVSLYVCACMFLFVRVCVSSCVCVCACVFMCVVASVCMHVAWSGVWAKGPEAHEVVGHVTSLVLFLG